MARDLSPITKQSRREGVPLHPKAMRIMVKRTNPPGQSSGYRRRARASQYSLQLREKQKAKRLYGLLEKQFRNLVAEASKSRGQTGEVLMTLLERRLDNVVFKAGFAPSRRAARQLVSHGHFNVNGKRVNIPSLRVSAGDVIELRSKSTKNTYFTTLDDLMENVDIPQTSWLKVERPKFKITVGSLPAREEADQDINEQLIVEYYSR